MAISSKNNSGIARMTTAGEYFSIGDEFFYKPLSTMAKIPDYDGEEILIKPVELIENGDEDMCRGCVLSVFCGRVDNRLNNLCYVPECRHTIRQDRKDVIFAKV